MPSLKGSVLGCLCARLARFSFMWLRLGRVWRLQEEYTGCRAVECPELAHLPPFLRSEVTMALLEGNMQRAQVLLTRVPVETCHMCDVPGHNLYNCPQLDSMPRHMRADLANAFRTANVKWRQKILAEWKHLDAAR